VDGNTYNLAYGCEDHMIGVTGPVWATFEYVGDVARPVGTAGVTTTVYIGKIISPPSDWRAPPRRLIHLPETGVQWENATKSGKLLETRPG
jgi:hypothetical protein